MIKVIAIVALVVTIYLCVKYTQQGSPEIELMPVEAVVINVANLKAMQQIYIPVNLESNTKNGHLNIRTILKIRNTSSSDSAYLTRIDYYDSQGVLIKKFLESTVLIKPMATREVAIVNNEFKTKGDNFLVQWYSNNPDHRPFIQTVSLDDANRVVIVEHGIETDSRKLE